MFSFNPEMAIGDSMDDGEEAFDAYIRDEDEDVDGNVKVSCIFNLGQLLYKPFKKLTKMFNNLIQTI